MAANLVADGALNRTQWFTPGFSDADHFAPFLKQRDVGEWIVIRPLAMMTPDER